MFEWEGLAVSALTGALGGGVGWLVTQPFRARKKTMADAVAVGITVLSFTLGNQLLTPALAKRREGREHQATGLKLFGNERSAAFYAETVGPHARDPRLIKRVDAAADPAAAHGVVAGVTHAGFARLPLEDLETTFALKRVMAAKSEEVCAGLWTGNMPEPLLMKGLRALDEAQQRAWIEIMGRAMAAELGATSPPPPLEGAATGEAMQALVAGLTPEARQAFTTAAATAQPSDALACQGFQAASQGLASATPRDRALALRLLTNPELALPH